MNEIIYFQKGSSRLAIDIGNVISQQLDTSIDDSNNNHHHHNFGSNTAAKLTLTSPTLECTEACRKLVQYFGAENTYILSKCRSMVQKATVVFLSNPLIDDDDDDGGGENFFQRTGFIPRNVIFCTKRSGGEVIEPKKLRLVPLDKRQNKSGPRVALGEVGKGAVARLLQLTHMIDDRDDCLLSFVLEGHLMETLTKDDVAGAVFHFGVHAAIPTSSRIEGFLDSHERTIMATSNKTSGRKPKTSKTDITEICQRLWHPVHGWSDVLRHFGILTEETTAAKIDTKEDDTKRAASASTTPMALKCSEKAKNSNDSEEEEEEDKKQIAPTNTIPTKDLVLE